MPSKYWQGKRRPKLKKKRSSLISRRYPSDNMKTRTATRRGGCFCFHSALGRAGRAHFVHLMHRLHTLCSLTILRIVQFVHLEFFAHTYAQISLFSALFRQGYPSSALCLLSLFSLRGSCRDLIASTALRYQPPRVPSIIIINSLRLRNSV